MKRIRLNLPAPYVGLRPFTEKEALLFFGRDAHVQDLVSKLERKQRFVAVLGASGSGKSSLVRAGLIPALHRGALGGAGHRWNVCTFKPGDAPLANLTQALAEDERWLDGDDRALAISALASSLTISPLALIQAYRERSERFNKEALLLVVDQFEEIFRYRQRDIDEAETFIKLLLRSASEDVPIFVVITMRSDFLGNCVAFFGLPEMINHGIYLTPRLEREQLKSVIASPLALVGGRIDPLLVNQLTNGLAGDDELPILQHALLRMWNRVSADQRSSIESSDFEAVCSLSVGTPQCSMLSITIDAHASEIYDAFSEQQKALARQLFLSLVKRGEGREVRRPQEFGQLLEVIGAQHREPLLSIIEAFRADDVGFLLPPRPQAIDDRTVIDISHESLMRRWNLLHHWIDEEEQDATELQEWVRRATRRQQGGSWLDEGDCRRAGLSLKRVRERWNVPVWATRYVGSEQFELTQSYVESSGQRIVAATLESQRRERLEEARIRARLRLFRVGFAVVLLLLIVTVMSAVLAYKQSIAATKESERLAAALEGAELSRTVAEANSKAGQLAIEKLIKSSADLALVAKQTTPPNSEANLRLTQAGASLDKQVNLLRKATQVPPTIYIHIAEDGQRAAAKDLQLRIGKTKFGDGVINTPGVELLSAYSRNQLSIESGKSQAAVLRCFRAQECQRDAPDLLNLVNAQLATPVVTLLDLSRRYGNSVRIRERHFELWFGPGEITLQAQLGQGEKH